MHFEKKIQFHFKLFNDDGEVIDDSRQSNQPVAFTLGKSELKPAKLESYLIDLNPGDLETFTLNANEAFGSRDDSAVSIVPISDIRLAFEGESIEIGKKVQVLKEENEELVPTDCFYNVTGILNGMVCLDANHPLAGKNLTYEIEVLSVEEIEKNEVNIEDEK